MHDLTALYKQLLRETYKSRVTSRTWSWHLRGLPTSSCSVLAPSDMPISTLPWLNGLLGETGDRLRDENRYNSGPFLQIDRDCSDSAALVNHPRPFEGTGHWILMLVRWPALDE